MIYKEMKKGFGGVMSNVQGRKFLNLSLDLLENLLLINEVCSKTGDEDFLEEQLSRIEEFSILQLGETSELFGFCNSYSIAPGLGEFFTKGFGNAELVLLNCIKHSEIAEYLTKEEANKLRIISEEAISNFAFGLFRQFDILISMNQIKEEKEIETYTSLAECAKDKLMTPVKLIEMLYDLCKNHFPRLGVLRENPALAERFFDAVPEEQVIMLIDKFGENFDISVKNIIAIIEGTKSVEDLLEEENING